MSVLAGDVLISYVYVDIISIPSPSSIALLYKFNVHSTIRCFPLHFCFVQTPFESSIDIPYHRDRSTSVIINFISPVVFLNIIWRFMLSKNIMNCN